MSAISLEQQQLLVDHLHQNENQQKGENNKQEQQQKQEQEQQLSDIIVVVEQDNCNNRETAAVGAEVTTESSTTITTKDAVSTTGNTRPPTTSFVSPPASPSHENFLKLHKTRDCNIIVKVFEARALPEARLRKKESSKNNNNKSFKRAQSLLTEISSPNLMTFSDTTDPYCVVQLDKQKQRTRTIPKKLNPFWCEEFSLEVQDPNSDKLVVSIIDEKKYTNDDFIGKIVIPINTLKDQRERELWFPLQTPTSSKKVPQIQILIDFKPISLADPSVPGHISWKILYGRNLMPTTAAPNEVEIGTPYINWSVRSKKGDIIIDEDGVSWFTALNTGVSKELTESIDCVNFMLWRYEPKQSPSLLDQQLQQSGSVPISHGSRSRSTTSIDHLISKSPEKMRSQSSVGSISPPLSPNSPAFSDTSSTCSLNSSTGGGLGAPTEGWEPVVLGQGIIMASHMDTEKQSDVWLCLYPRQSAENKLGDVRLKLKYSEEVVLPIESYTPLLNLIQDPKMNVIQILGNISKQREAIANNLIRIFEKTNKCVDLLKSLTDQEIETTDNPEIIFRGNSLATKSLDLYMKLVGLPYLMSTIGPLIKKIYTSKKSCEIDPTKLEKGEDAKKNSKNLLSWVKKVTAAIFESANQCPGPLREVFRAIQSKVHHRYPSDEVTRYTAVSGFIFLRFFCPSILAPKLFELMPDHPGMKTTRSLILIAKTLQNLANLVELGEYKEDFMRDMNRFVLENIGNMKSFIDNVAQVPANCASGELLNPISLEKELACLHRQLIKQKDDMWQEVNERNIQEQIDTMNQLDSILSKLEEEVITASSL